MEPDYTILLHPNIPKPMHNLAPRKVMGKSWWNAEKKKALEKADGFCMACGEENIQLECHECYDIDYEKGIMLYTKTVAICKDCHAYIHSGRLAKIAQVEEYNRIIKRGNSLLLKAKIQGEEYEGNVAAWDKWKLVVDEKEYKSMFRDYEAWYKYYNQTKTN